MSRLSYEDTKVSAANTHGAIRELMQKYGAQSLGFMENFKDNRLLIQFRYKDLPVQIEITWEKYYKLLRDRYSGPDEVLRGKAQRAVLRAVFYWLKANFEFMELGILEFEDIFMSHFMRPDGVTLGRVIKGRLPVFIAGQLQIGTNQGTNNYTETT